MGYAQLDQCVGQCGKRNGVDLKRLFVGCERGGDGVFAVIDAYRSVAVVDVGHQACVETDMIAVARFGGGVGAEYVGEVAAACHHHVGKLQVFEYERHHFGDARLQFAQESGEVDDCGFIALLR